MSVKIEKKSKYIPMADENDNHFKYTTQNIDHSVSKKIQQFIEDHGKKT